MLFLKGDLLGVFSVNFKFNSLIIPHFLLSSDYIEYSKSSQNISLILIFCTYFY